MDNMMDSRLRGNDNNSKLRVVFLDRDGVIHEDRSDYVKSASELKIFPYVPGAIRRLNEAGFEVIVISNQQGVGKGLMSFDDLMDVQRDIDKQVSCAGGKITAYYYCTHLAADNCDCRKPKPGLLAQAAEEHNVDLASAYMIGDTERDIISGREAGCKTVLVLSGKLSKCDLEDLDCRPDFVANDLAGAVDIVLGQ